MDFKDLLFQKEEGIATITLNRPHALNAFSINLTEELGKALRMVKDDPEINVVILTGSGRAFSAGLDIKEMGTVPTSDRRHPLHSIPPVFDFVRTLEQPVICAINGHTITGGFELALQCDILIASEDAVLRDTHARIGVVPGAGNTQNLPRIMGLSNAMTLLLSSKAISAHEALRLGIVSEVVPRDKLLERAKELAREIMAGDMTTVRWIKKVVREGMMMELGNALLVERIESKLCVELKSADDIRKSGGKLLKKEDNPT